MELIDALSQAYDETEARIAKIQPDQMGNQTPCDEWDVKGLLEHTIGTVGFLTSAVSGEAPGEPGDVLGEDAAASFRAAADASLAAWRQRGLDGTIDLGGNDMPAQVVATINLLDTYVHGWDVAKATGQDPTLDEQLANMIYEGAQPMFPGARANGFAEEVAVGDAASATDRCVAFLGRQP